MPEPLDDRIRELFEELDAAAPDVPPMPQVSSREPRTIWTRVLVPAAGLAVVILVLGVAGQILFSSSDSGDQATATTASDAADRTEAPAETRPPDRALALAQLNLACTTFIADGTVSGPPANPQEFHTALIELEAPVFDLSDSIQQVGNGLRDPEFDSIVDAAVDVADLVAQGAVGPVATAQDTYNEVNDDLGDLGDSLAGYGALDCANLETTLG